ncbi:DUF2812 domain-containing protein [Intestinimonas sp. HCP28S3_D6]|uniref:DUF2812 domain-containing protein n=1 Tax=Intestinimonas sp. HCP28S3_D6 TaxID=3438942 RepID=UPI003F8A262D
MKTDSWSLFTYPVMDIKAAEALLNRRAAEGWTLDRVYLGTFARFVPFDTRSAWCVDWSRPGYSERPDYLTLCTDAGWTLVQKVGAFNLYKASVGTPPIQTDGVEEARRFRQEVLRATFKGWGVLLGLLLFLAALVLLVSGGAWRKGLLDLLLTQTGLFLLLFLPAILACWLFWASRLLLRLQQWDRTSGGPLPVPGRTSAGVAAWLCLLCRLWGVAVVICFLMDTGQRMRLSTALGLLVGGCIGLYLNRDRKDKEGRKLLSRRGTVAIYGLILLSVTVLSPIFSPLSDVLMPPPVLVKETVLPGAVRVDRSFSRSVSYADTDTSSIGSFGLRHQSWWEDPSGEQHDVDCYTARWEWLSRLVQALLWEPWYPPLDGYTDVWLQEASLGGGKTESLLLLRSGKTVVMVETRSGPIPRSQIDRLLSLLSSDQEV